MPLLYRLIFSSSFSTIKVLYRRNEVELFSAEIGEYSAMRGTGRNGVPQKSGILSNNAKVVNITVGKRGNHF